VATAPLFATALKGAAQGGAAAERWLYVGTYTTQGNTGSKGIYAWKFQASTGKVTSAGVAAETDNPSFVAIHPGKKYLYAVNELAASGAADPNGGVSAFSIDAMSGKLTLLNRVNSRGQNPAHLIVDPTGTWVIIGNYGAANGTAGTSVAVFRVRTNGGLDDEPVTFVPHVPRTDTGRPPAAHPHNVHLSPDGRFLLVADKGLDRIVVYHWDGATGKLTPNNPPFADAPTLGSGPRHMAFGKSGKFLYVCHEQGRSVSTYAYDAAKGALTLLDTVASVPADVTTGSTAEIEVHPDGNFVYASNRGHDSIAIFAVDPAKGTLSLKGTTPTGGRTPRNFKIDPTGDYLFAENQASALTTIFKIDRKTGQLTPSGATLDSPGAVCIAFA
jgi:6-phosphogluconolactonase